MPTISTKTLKKIKMSLDIKEVAEDFGMILKRNFTRCIFHPDNNPSMSFKDAMFKCFSCGAHGDVFDLVGKLRNCDFVESVGIISSRYGIAIDFNNDPHDKHRDTSRIYEQSDKLLSGIARNLNNLLLENKTSLCKDAREYLKSRGITSELINMFCIGFCESKDIIYKFINETNQKEVSASNNLYPITNSMFSNRIVMPIINKSNRCIGFSCRTIDEKSVPKYINTTNTQTFNKKNCFFGEHLAVKEIKRSGLVVLVEGQLDAVMMHGIGVSNCVANQGTAFSEENARHIKSLEASRVIIFFDGDKAGLESSIKISEILIKNKIEPFVYRTRKGKDPCEMIANEGFLLSSTQDAKSLLVNCIGGKSLILRKVKCDFAMKYKGHDKIFETVNDIEEYDCSTLLFSKDLQDLEIKKMRELALEFNKRVSESEAENIKIPSKSYDDSIVALIKIIISCAYKELEVDFSSLHGVFGKASYGCLADIWDDVISKIQANSKVGMSELFEISEERDSKYREGLDYIDSFDINMLVEDIHDGSYKCAFHSFAYDLGFEI